MKPINLKLFRDLWQMRGQAIAIALVITSGVATFVMSLTTLDSLLNARDNYYTEYRFADVFATLKRAPESIATRVYEIPGVVHAETRVVASVNIDLGGFPDPVTGEIFSIPDTGEPLLNRLYLRRGRLPDPGRDDEVVISESFAEAHGLVPGDSLKAVIRGKKKSFLIVGTAMSPEHIYQIGPGAIFPDFERYTVMWMARTPLASAYDMEGAFNDLVLKLDPRASIEDVIERLDLILDPYGGFGAIGRKDQFSHHFLSEELDQLKTVATVFPVIFLGVASFLLNVVISRLISTQRDQIAILKAFGYSNITVGAHYLGMVLLVVVFGLAGGIAAGAWMGSGLSSIYMKFYRFPSLDYILAPWVVAAAAGVTVFVTVAGTLLAVWRAAVLPPATAMSPEPPPVYRETVVERFGLKRLLAQPSRMIVRHIERRPVKSLLTVIGIAFACGIMMVGNFQEDSVDFMIYSQFVLGSREDMTVFFVEPTSAGALHELTSLRGVNYGEAVRVVPARLRFEHRTYRTSIQGVEPRGRLKRILDLKLKPIEIPPEGMVLNDHLGKILGVRPGDVLTVEVLEGERPVLQIPVAALAKQYLGVGAYMERSALNRLMNEGGAISAVFLDVDSLYEKEIYAELKETPRVAGVVISDRAIESFYKTISETVLFFTFISTLLGGSIAFGVVYNSARIALSERSRELASLRVLGFTEGEISYILLGEFAFLTIVAIPIGFLIGRGLCAYLALQLESDLYRVPLILEPDTYAFAAVVVFGSAIISGLAIWRKLVRLDLVAALKTKE